LYYIWFGCAWHCNFEDKKYDFKPNRKKIILEKKIIFEKADFVRFQIADNEVFFLNAQFQNRKPKLILRKSPDNLSVSSSLCDTYHVSH